MTMAICFNCGAMKFGAFTPCLACSVKPESDDDIVTSLALTDHYLSPAELAKLGARIKSGERMRLADEQHAEFMKELREMKKDKTIRKMMGLDSESNSA